MLKTQLRLLSAKMKVRLPRKKMTVLYTTTPCNSITMFLYRVKTKHNAYIFICINNKNDDNSLVETQLAEL